MSRSVGLRDLKNHLGGVVRRVRRGETVTVTDRRRPLAVIVPLRSASPEALIGELVRAGRVAWCGGKPSGSARPQRVRGPAVSDAVVEDRR